MNERINGLWWQARIGYNNQNCDPEVVAKFAELIVRDCMDVVDGYTKPRTFDTHYDAVEQIEALFGIKHNGVEE
jgi:hypothetical protein